MENTRQSRVLEIFFRGLRGEDLSVQQLADEYNVSTKSITRSINDLKAFLADHRELVGNTELLYSHQAKCYRLYMDEFLSSKELFALLEVMIGARAFSRIELLALTDKLKRFTTPDDRQNRRLRWSTRNNPNRPFFLLITNANVVQRSQHLRCRTIPILRVKGTCFQNDSFQFFTSILRCRYFFSGEPPVPCFFFHS